MLTKFCKPDHNPNKVSRDKFRLRVGTLYDFRKHENSELSDGWEGKYEYRLSLPFGTTVETEWINSIQQVCQYGEPVPPIDLIGRIRASGFSGELVQDSSGRAVCRLLGGGRLEYEHPNAFVFCVSKGLDESPFETQRDYWSFPETRAQEFAALLGRTLARELTDQHLKPMEGCGDIRSMRGPDAVPPSVDGGIGLTCVLSAQGSVQYEQNLELVRGPDDMTREGLIERLKSAPFSKPLKYFKECEYRFLFLPVRNGHDANEKIILEPSVTHIDLKVPWLCDFLSQR